MRVLFDRRFKLLILFVFFVTASARAAPGASQSIRAYDPQRPTRAWAAQADIGGALRGEYDLRLQWAPAWIGLGVALGYRSTSAALLGDDQLSSGVVLRQGDALTLDLSLVWTPERRGNAGLAWSFAFGGWLPTRSSSRTASALLRCESVLSWSSSFDDVLVTLGAGAQLWMDPNYGEFSVEPLLRVAIGYSFWN